MKNGEDFKYKVAIWRSHENSWRKYGDMPFDAMHEVASEGLWDIMDPDEHFHMDRYLEGAQAMNSWIDMRKSNGRRSISTVFNEWSQAGPLGIVKVGRTRASVCKAWKLHWINYISGFSWFVHSLNSEAAASGIIWLGMATCTVVAFTSAAWIHMNG